MNDQVIIQRDAKNVADHESYLINHIINFSSCDCVRISQLKDSLTDVVTDGKESIDNTEPTTPF